MKEKERTCHLTDEGVRMAEKLAGVDSFYTAGNMEWPHLIDNALKAHYLYKRDVNYVSMSGEIIIVDEFTGRLMPGRRWSRDVTSAARTSAPSSSSSASTALARSITDFGMPASRATCRP